MNDELKMNPIWIYFSLITVGSAIGISVTIGANFGIGRSLGVFNSGLQPQELLMNANAEIRSAEMMRIMVLGSIAVYESGDDDV